jgi:hypothetical protein
VAGILARFDPEHTFRLFKQVLGWTAPKIRSPQAADQWTWLIIAAHAQLRLARTPAADLRLPWQRPAPQGRLTPARVRRGFRNIRARQQAARSARRKPANPALAARQDRRTAVPHPATTSERPPDENSPSKPSEKRQGKRHAKAKP